MANPSVFSVGTNANNANPAAPPSVALGQLLLISARGNGTGSGAAVAGFSSISIVLDTTSLIPGQIWLFWKIADASDVSLSASSGSYSITSLGASPSSFAAAIIDHDPVSPIFSTTGGVNPSNSTDTPALSLAGLPAGALLFFIDAAGTTFQMTTPPTGFARTVPLATRRMQAANGTQVTAGSSGSIVATNNGSFIWNAGLIAIKPGVASDLREYNGTTEVLLSLKEFTSPSTETDLTLYEYDGASQVLLH